MCTNMCACGGVCHGVCTAVLIRASMRGIMALRAYALGTRKCCKCMTGLVFTAPAPGIRDPLQALGSGAVWERIRERSRAAPTALSLPVLIIYEI